MKSLSALCHALNIDFSELAERADLPVDNLQAWANSDDVPGLKDLRDVAVALGTSVSDMLAMELREMRPTLESRPGADIDRVVIDAFWGYVVVERADGHRHFFPISEDTAREIEDEMREGGGPFSIHTLSHSVLVLAPRNMSAISLIEADADNEALDEHMTDGDVVHQIVNAELASAAPVLLAMNIAWPDIASATHYPAGHHWEWAANPDTEELRIRLDQAMGYCVSDLFKFRALRHYANMATRPNFDPAELASAFVQRTDRRCDVLKHVSADSCRRLIEDLDGDYSGAYTLSFGRKARQTVHYPLDEVAIIEFPLSILHTLMAKDSFEEQVEILRGQKAAEDQAFARFITQDEAVEDQAPAANTRPHLRLVKQ